MRKEITPEMYNYNKYPGPQFRQVDQLITADDIELSLLENYKDAFNAEIFSQRFSDILLKYDYIVGDWGNEQLRLKGFYKESQGPGLNIIDRVQDYLNEYCNFGCAYFILGNSDPKAPVKEADEDLSHRRKRRRHNKSHRNHQSQFKISEARSHKRDDRHQVKKSKNSGSDQHFTIRQKNK